MFETFGNIVRIKSSPETDKLSLTDRTGIVLGETMPSTTGVEVIGNAENDIAINVYFEDTKESYWFSKYLIEEIESGEGIVMTLDGVDKKWTKNKNGAWNEENLNRKRWWKFWK
jgi:hypothetical protein